MTVRKIYRKFSFFFSFCNSQAFAKADKTRKKYQNRTQKFRKYGAFPTRTVLFPKVTAAFDGQHTDIRFAGIAHSCIPASTIFAAPGVPKLNHPLPGTFLLVCIAIIVLAAVFLLIAVRQVGRFTLKIWQIMLGGAAVVLGTGQISPGDAIFAINPDVMLFLFGMFIVGEALVTSGYLACLAHRFFSRTRNPDELVLAILFGTGMLSALLMNDTLAIIGTPLVLGLAARSRLQPRLLLLALAFAITTGSVMSPIGNPQNLLLAINSGMSSPFVVFASYLLIPTIICLIVPYGILKLAYRGEFSSRTLTHEPPVVCDACAALPVKIALAVILFLAGANIIFSLLGGKILITLPLIAIVAAAPVLILSRNRVDIVKRIDWHTLVFFAAMFVLMASVWQTGFFQSMFGNGRSSSIPAVLAISIIISQFISNVPFIALFQPLIMQANGSMQQLMALAAGSTIAGNLTILGAASNVIIIQNAEKQGETLTFFEFMKVGLPITVMQVLVYWVFLTIL